MAEAQKNIYTHGSMETLFVFSISLQMGKSLCKHSQWKSKGRIFPLGKCAYACMKCNVTTSTLALQRGRDSA